MKVNIITRHAVANYGSVLQAYATQKAIEKLGHESEIINYVRYDEQGKNISDTMLRRNKKWNSNIIFRCIYKIVQTNIYNGTYKAFKRFRKGFLNESEQLYSCDDDLKNVPEGDVYCTGSDQVWGMIGNVNYDKNYFLDFALGKKCISYAASFGKSDLSTELKKDLSGLLKKYSSVLVREKSAKELLESLGIKSEQVLDPTLLLNEDDWNEVTDNNIKDKGYVLIYQLHNNKKLEKYAKDFADRTGKKLIRISVSWLYMFKSGKLVYLPTPGQFLGYFKNCDYVITDSFHATVFSIIFNKSFVDVLPKGTGTRIVSLLEILGLKNRIVDNYEDFSLIDKVIDYTLVKEKLQREQIRSLKLLKDSIEN